MKAAINPKLSYMDKTIREIQENEDKLVVDI